MLANLRYINAVGFDLVWGSYKMEVNLNTTRCLQLDNMFVVIKYGGSFMCSIKLK